jgi:hypothetical protein
MFSNVQQRVVPAPVDVVGPILERIAPGGGIWPSPRWPTLRLERGLAVGSSGGHGPIRYACVGYEPGRWVRFAFDPAIGLVGHHEFVVREVPGGTEVTHLIVGERLTGPMQLLWPLVVRWLHEALLQDLLDNWERAATGTVRRPAHRSPWVRLVRRLPLPGRRTSRASRAERPERTHREDGQPTASSQSRA